MLSITSLSLDSTLFGLEIFPTFNREVWAANDVCTELRTSILRTPFAAYGQRTFYDIRSPDDLYVWLNGPLGHRLFANASAPVLNDAARSQLLGGFRLKQIRIENITGKLARPERPRTHAGPSRTPGARPPRAFGAGLRGLGAPRSANDGG